MSSIYNLSIKSFGPIKEASLSLGDLTVLVGPQATGKSIALQLLKLAIDAGQVQKEMGRYGLDWSGKLPAFLDAYLGEGMASAWRPGRSEIHWRKHMLDLPQIARRRRRAKPEELFFIPAQRVLTLRDGWPRPFTDYAPGDPFAVREFSEKLRSLVESEFSGESLFPQSNRLKKDLRGLLQSNVFAKHALKVDKLRSQKRLVLGESAKSDPLPYMVWSAGQREFVPLLLGLYWLLPPSAAPRRGSIRWVALEELEMGLHPRAISVVLLMVFELIHRGYRVCLSTHSPQILDAMWALKHLRRAKQGAEQLLEIFGAPKTPGLLAIAKSMLRKSVRVHYFDRSSGSSRDISNLDPSSEASGESGFGGLSEFSGKANEAVATAVAAG